MKKSLFLAFIFSSVLLSEPSFGQSQNTQGTQLSSSLFSGLKLRNLTPAKTGGRIVDIAFHPENRSIRYVAVASGGVWKTVNAGTTWTPIFDNQGSFSIGTVVIDPKNPNTVWVGTGENNAQRSVSKGDGVYKSTDGGKTWTNMGLETSEHIGKIVFHPEDSDIVFVASQGSVWAPGGERGLYKTSNGGKSWERILDISENTGISDVIIDPRNPDHIIASSYQRRRHFGILVAGGPDGGAFKSEDGGETWSKLSNGFPQGDLGRIGLARSPQKPDVLYALVAGTESTKGFYRSADNGSSWIKMNDYMVIDAQYYMEIFPDPHQFDKLYIVDVITKVSEDGGKTLKGINHDRIHVDNHEMEFDPNDPNYLLIAGDGGIYESWDNAENWRFTDNLPITQFYRVGIDNEAPFYNVYGGTQDNNTIGGPSRTINRAGIKNSDWFNTLGGDGFQTRIDPTDPNIVYSMYQYAGIVRFDRKTGEKTDIQPQPGAGEPPYRWNWDAPLVLSVHDPQTLYFAANKLMKSTDRGNSWTEISGDLTREMDRNQMEVMGRVWGIDAIFKNVWTSPYGTIVALAESPIQQGLLYVGTDDGLIQVSEDDGQSWKKIEGISGVPKLAYLSDIFASPHDENTVFAVFNYHKYGDYKPYFYRSDDKGKSWKSISSNLPEGDFGWTIVQDHINPDLLFAGTEYGLYFSVDAGNEWVKFTNGIPTIAIRDLEIQRRENDLVAASFGRGFYILDDYSALREIDKDGLASESIFFPVKDTWSYIPANPDGYALGANFFASPNPTYGAVFTYYLKESESTLAQKRKKAEADRVKNGEPVPYPDWEEFNKEKREEGPKVTLSIRNESGDLVARVTGPARQGIQRTAWNLRHSGIEGNNGPMALPGTYTASMEKLVDGEWQDLGQSREFIVKALHEGDSNSDQEFRLEVLALDEEIDQADELNDSMIEAIGKAQDQLKNRGNSIEEYEKAEMIRQSLMNLKIQLNGNPLITQKMELIPPSIANRVSRVRNDAWSTTGAVTATQKESIEVAKGEFTEWKRDFNSINAEIRTLASALSNEGIMLRTSEDLPLN